METRKQKNNAANYGERLTHSNDVHNDGVLIIQDSARAFLVRLNIAVENGCSKKEATVRRCSINKVVLMLLQSP